MSWMIIEIIEYMRIYQIWCSTQTGWLGGLFSNKSTLKLSEVGLEDLFNYWIDLEHKLGQSADKTNIMNPSQQDLIRSTHLIKGSFQKKTRLKVLKVAKRLAKVEKMNDD